MLTAKLVVFPPLASPAHNPLENPHINLTIDIVKHGVGGSGVGWGGVRGDTGRRTTTTTTTTTTAAAFVLHVPQLPYFLE